jgi:hypothetical protein
MAGVLAILIILSNPWNIVLAQEPALSCPLATIPGEVDVSYFLSWANAPPAILNPGEHAAISVKGRAVDGRHNLMWSVSGDGFSFAENDIVQSVETTAGQLTLYAHGVACGTAAIGVVDFAGNTVGAYVRSNSGLWEVCGEDPGCWSPGMLVYGESIILHPYRIRWSESKYWNGACYDVTADCGGFSYTQEPRVWDSSGTLCRCIGLLAIDQWVCQ